MHRDMPLCHWGTHAARVPARLEVRHAQTAGNMVCLKHLRGGTRDLSVKGGYTAPPPQCTRYSLRVGVLCVLGCLTAQAPP